MKLYRTPTGHWAGTKDDAAALAKAHGTTFEQCEVPYDKPGLLAFLNEHRVGAVADTTDDPEEVVPTGSTFDTPPTPAVFNTQETAHQKQMRRLDVEEFIFAAPLEVAMAMGEIAMNRMRDFAREKKS